VVNGPNPPTDSNCASASGIDNATGITVAPDNKSVYVASSVGNSLAEFSRNQSTEELNQLNEPFDCVGTTAVNCSSATNISGPRAVAITPDGAGLYSTAGGASALIAFSRELPPVCSNASRTVLQDTPAQIALACTDVNGDPLDRAILMPPAHGTLSGDPDSGAVTYAPAAGYLGPDSLTFNAEDLPVPSQVSSPATVSIAVTAPVAPGATPQGAATVQRKKRKCKKHRKLRRGKCVRKKRKRK
ncbi:MAG: Ig-like domain-containing protein, partial [Solirubrobacterales bacterium]